MKAASILPFHFSIMTILGVWCPEHWSPLKKYLHHIHTLIVFTSMSTIVCLQLARLTFVKLSLGEFNDTLYITIATVGACFKLIQYLIHRDRVMKLINMFQEDCSVPHDDFEWNIKQNYDYTCKKIGRIIVLLVESSVIAFVTAPLNSDGIEMRKLPYEVLQVYDMSNPLIYWLSFAHHCYGGVLFAGVHITSDVIITGFMIQLCGQFDLMAHRLDILPEQARQMNSHDDPTIIETRLLKSIVQHHVHIYNLSKTLMTTFNRIIAAQFYASTAQICLTIYQLTFRASNTLEMINHGGFLISMLCTIGNYCYFGNELTIKSMDLRDSIYNTDWSSLTRNTQKNLAFMICRASRPIEISDGAFLSLTMQTFVSIVKISYSTISVIKSA